MSGNVISQNKNLSGVIWITGYSASGKTTIGRRVALSLREAGVRTIFLDGDDLRSIFANKWGYSRTERIELAKIYFRLCSHLAAQDFTVVISAIAMYNEVRDWIRQNIEGSIEVFLDVPESERRRRDQSTKGIYLEKNSDDGIYDPPTSSDITIENFGEKNPDRVAAEICTYFKRYGYIKASDKGRTSHWNSYYEADKAPSNSSSFAKYLVDNLLIPNGKKLIEIGCGNGRDAIFLSSKGYQVTALDTSNSAIEYCRKTYPGGNVNFLLMKIDEFFKEKDEKFDVVYSRFSLHAMTPPEEREFLEYSKELLSNGGKLFIECRSINDPLARKGEIISSTERIHGHYRRFIVLPELVNSLRKHGFYIELAEEYSGVAKLGDDDPVVIRVMAVNR